MTFEEFFKKKKIDLEQLKAAEGVLFAEFEAHYAVMGEKSFDHTKKYWFNELRRKYHTPEEIKAEKNTIENPIAEQTVIDSITNEVPEANPPKLGFKPKFKAAISTPAESAPITPEEAKPAETVTATPTPKLGFKPKFKGAATTPAENTSIAPEEAKPADPETTAAPKLGFKPKFKAAATTPANTQPIPTEATKPAEPITEIPAPKLGFKPKFKAQNIKPKTEEE